MSIIHVTGNIFTSRAQTIVNTVNCEGVMGAGIALECRLRYPQMFETYLKLCDNGLLKPGKLWIWRGPSRWVLNFPTKNSWKHPSRMDYLEQGLDKLVATWQQQQLHSIALPLLGTDRGGLPPDQVISLMERKLNQLAKAIPVEIYHYDPKATDDLYQEFSEKLLTANHELIKQTTGISLDKLSRIDAAVRGRKIYQLNQLAGIEGIGEKTLEKIFLYCQTPLQSLNQDQQEFNW